MAHGAYPNSLEKIGYTETEEGPYYYNLEGDYYILSFKGVRCFFCMQNYNSKTQEWIETD